MSLVSSVVDAVLAMLKIGLVILPLTVGYQIVRDSGWIRSRLGPHRKSLQRVGLGEAAIVPLAAGVVLGIVYGAGILIQEAREGRMTRRELFRLGLFLSTCHAVIEDTLLFVVVGADPFWLLLPRIFLAFAATALLARLPRRAQRAIAGSGTLEGPSGNEEGRPG